MAQSMIEAWQVTRGSPPRVVDAKQAASAVVAVIEGIFKGIGDFGLLNFQRINQHTHYKC